MMVAGRPSNPKPTGNLPIISSRFTRRPGRRGVAMDGPLRPALQDRKPAQDQCDDDVSLHGVHLLRFSMSAVAGARPGDAGRLRGNGLDTNGQAEKNADGQDPERQPDDRRNRAKYPHRMYPSLARPGGRTPRSRVVPICPMSGSCCDNSRMTRGRMVDKGFHVSAWAGNMKQRKAPGKRPARSPARNRPAR